jgi:hypothetical protein
MNNAALTSLTDLDGRHPKAFRSSRNPQRDSSNCSLEWASASGRRTGFSLASRSRLVVEKQVAELVTAAIS